MKTFQEYLNESFVSDSSGPGAGKHFKDMTDDEHSKSIEYHKSEISKLKSSTSRTSHNTQNHISNDASHHSKNSRSLGGNFKAKADMNHHINKMSAHQDYLENK